MVIKIVRYNIITRGNNIIKNRGKENIEDILSIKKENVM
jgi:hypothetical protein